VGVGLLGADGIVATTANSPCQKDCILDVAAALSNHWSNVKLSTYIVRADSGFSPNPFGRYCTLACCKPTVRRCTESGDVIVGSGSAGSGLSGKLIYAMRVLEVLPYQDYWERYPSKRPSSRTPASKRGDNIWHKDRAGVWRGVRGALHDDHTVALEQNGIGDYVRRLRNCWEQKALRPLREKSYQDPVFVTSEPITNAAPSTR
jgi:hypothetical protein